MKKSIEAPERSVQKKSQGKPSSTHAERGDDNPIKKPFRPVTNTDRAEGPNAHSPVDDELNIPHLPDKEDETYTPSQAPW